MRTAIVFVSLLLCVVFLTTGTAYADEASSDTPFKSNWWQRLSSFVSRELVPIGEIVQGWSIRDPEKRTHFEFNRARRRLSDARDACARDNECERVNRYLERYQRQFDRALEWLKKTESSGTDTRALSETIRENYLTHLTMIEETIEAAGGAEALTTSAAAIVEETADRLAEVLSAASEIDTTRFRERINDWLNEGEHSAGERARSFFNEQLRSVLSAEPSE